MPWIDPVPSMKESTLARAFNMALACFTAGGLHTAFAADGDIDTSFGNSGYIVLNSLMDHSPPLLTQAAAVAVDGQGRIVITGAAQHISAGPDPADGNFLLLRLHSNGELDDTFAADSGGYRLVDFDLSGIGKPGPDTATRVVVEPDGRIVVGGRAYFDDTDMHFGLVRVDDTGTPDATFGSGGMLHFGAFYSPINLLADLVVDSTGGVLIGGSIYFGSKEYAAVARITSNGAIDPGFNYGYIQGFAYRTEPAVAQYSYVNAMGLDDSGGIVTAGGFYDTTTGYVEGAAVRRLTPTGALDPAFGSGGPVQIASDPDAYLAARAIHVMPGGGFVVAGYSTGLNPYVYFAKFSASGVPDASFGTNGVATFPFGANGAPLLIAPTRRGGWMMAGSYSQQGYFIAKVLANGQPDTTLAGTGLVGVVFPQPIYDAFGLFQMANPALTADGRLVIAGSLPEAEANASGDIGVVQILADYDTLFVAGFE